MEESNIKEKVIKTWYEPKSIFVEKWSTFFYKKLFFKRMNSIIFKNVKYDLHKCKYVVYVG